MTESLFPRELASVMPPELALELGGLTLAGTSVAARATALSVAELGVALDLGRLTPAIAELPVVLLSHGHLDHLSAVLAYLNLRARFHPGEPPLLLGPEALIRPLRQALAVMPGMESVRKRLDLESVLRAVEPGETVELARCRATAFALEHSVPALGWRLTGAGEQRAALVYALDSGPEPFLAAPDLLDARVAIVECSLLERNRRVAARLSRHAHLSDWLELAPRLTCDHLVLAHLPPMPAADLAALAAPLAGALRGRLVLWSPPSEPA